MGHAIARIIEECLAGKAHQVAVPGRVLCQQDNGAVMSRPRSGAGALIGGLRKSNRQRASDDRLNAFCGERLREFERAEKIVPVGDGERGLAIGSGKFCQRLDRQRAFQQRIGGMDVKMDEFGLRHQLPQGRLSRSRR